MFINKTNDGRNNISGKNIAILKKQKKISQRILAERMRVSGIDIDIVIIF